MALQRKKLIRATIIYWFLLIYIFAALVWWYISLNEQNNMMLQFELKALNASTTSSSAAGYAEQLNKIVEQHKRNDIKYLSEGIFFFFVLLVGAFFLYRFVRRQFYMQQQQQNFMMAVTHELKTPISVARLNLETMQKYTLDPERHKKLIRTTLDETSRLDFLINNVLIASQLEGDGYQSTKEELDLSDLLKDCVQGFSNRYPDRKFYEEIAPGMDVKGDPLLLQMLINNLLENALKYSSKDQPITTKLNKVNNEIVLQVIDEGIGISAEEKKKIFSRFYRSGNEATRKTQGTGLGLYLCRKIAKDHNADITVTNNNTRGSIFAVRFKKK